MADSAGFAKLVPGFDFLQGLVKNAGAAMPAIGQWVAPTLNPEELEKRIEELRTVQFWLEQNARMLGATIQALEVQRMTLSTLKTMNVQLGDLRESLTLRPGAAGGTAAAGARPAPAATPVAAKAKADKTAPPAKAAAVPPVDPMQWWGALTQQFTQLATQAMKDGATDAAKNLAGAMIQQSFDAANQTLRSAASFPAKVAGAGAGAVAGVVKAAAKTATSAAAGAAANSARKAATAGARRPAAKKTTR